MTWRTVSRQQRPRKSSVVKKSSEVKKSIKIKKSNKVTKNTSESHAFGNRVMPENLAPSKDKATRTVVQVNSAAY